ncbi:MAG: hypothetical protein AB7V48_03600 [Sedimentibacter sp.]
MNYNNKINPYHVYNKLNNENNKIDVFFAEKQVPVNQEVGYIELFVFTERGKISINNATVTVFARQTALVGIPIKTITTAHNPVTIELPVAHPSGTLIQGPEYFFTTYNLTIRALGYSPVTVLNIRIFPGITVILDINLIEVIPGTLPIPEKVIDIPPHPRDVLTDQPIFPYDIDQMN